MQVIVQENASSSFPLGAKNHPEEAFSEGFALETQRKHTANNIEKQNLKHPPISKTHNDLKEELPSIMHTNVQVALTASTMRRRAISPRRSQCPYSNNHPEPLFLCCASCLLLSSWWFPHHSSTSGFFSLPKSQSCIALLGTRKKQQAGSGLCVLLRLQPFVCGAPT